MTATRAAIATFASLCLATPAAADDRYQQEAHVHGDARLQVAIDGRSAELILQSPAANLLGFEHSPRNAGQEATLAKTRQWLEATPLVQSDDAGCRVAASSVHHDQTHSDAHGHTDEQDHRHEGNHSSVEVTQRIECDRELAGPLTTPLMARFPGIEHLAVDWLSATGQGHTEVHGGETEVHLEH